jgi:hypothetical protein
MSLRSLPAAMLIALTGVACGSETSNPGAGGSFNTAGVSGGGAAGSSGGDQAAAGTNGGVAGSTAGGGAGGMAGGAGMAGAGGDAGTAASMPMLLSETGLYADIKNKTLAADVHKFTPAYTLWSDGAEKQRYVYMPPGGKITSDEMEWWRYPKGFKLWKDFKRDGKLIETRLLQKLSDGMADWYMVAFMWRDDMSDADAVPMGQVNAKGTMHDVPPKEACTGCHASVPDNAIGFSAVMLSHNLPDSLNISQIAQMGWLTTMPAAGGYPLPGTDTEKAAIGYLHANCGMCHNFKGQVYKTKSSFDAWTHVDQISDMKKTRAYMSLLCDQWPGDASKGESKFAPMASCPDGHFTGALMDTDISHPKRVVPKDVANSAIIDLMTLRATGQADMMKQMPPLGTEIPDTAGGLKSVSDWINGLQ